MSLGAAELRGWGVRQERRGDSSGAKQQNEMKLRRCFFFEPFFFFLMEHNRINERHLGWKGMDSGGWMTKGSGRRQVSKGQRNEEG